MNKKNKWMGLLLAAGGTAVLSQSAQASFDMDNCTWGSEGCMVTSPPVLGSDNDTRDNLIRLMGEKTPFVLPTHPDSIDASKTRDYYFSWHESPEYIESIRNMAATAAADAAAEVVTPDAVQATVTSVEGNQDVAQATAVVVTQDAAQEASTETSAPKPPVYAQAKELSVSDNLLEAFHKQEESLETRHISNTLVSVGQFYSALLADSSLLPEQRQSLALIRLKVNGSPETQIELSQLALPENSNAELFRMYLLGANYFYAGDYHSASSFFSELSKSQQPWLAETASYMLMRTELNRSSAGDTGEYGDFDVASVDKYAVQKAREQAQYYLQKWPAGLYAVSARGLLRRIDWYLGDWDQLALDLEQALKHPRNADDLTSLVAETDSKLLSKDLIRNDTLFMTAPDAPQLTFIQTLRLMRNDQCSNDQPCVDQSYLDNIKPIFEKGQALPLWQYLTLWLSWQKQDYTALLNNIAPVTDPLPEHDVLAFSKQALIGNVLMAQENWEAAHKFWLHLLSLSKSKEQQQYIQGMLAGVMVYEGHPEQIFAADSPVTNLHYRSLALKKIASPELLRQQVTGGMNNEEKTIALYTLLVKDLIAARYSDWLQDKTLISKITQPVKEDDFPDVDLAEFNWKGDQAEPGYYCPALEKTVTTLSTHADDSHALNCLGEFFRTSTAAINMGTDDEGSLALGTALEKVKDNGAPDRQSYYMQIIKNPRTEPEDKSFALYRAVMCYAPSGMNDCGGEEQENHVRKDWFNQLKGDFRGGVWERKLKYYW